MQPARQGPPSDKPKVRTRTPRPDELSRESFEFISAIDEYKRRHLRSFLSDEEVLAILFELGYHLPGRESGEPTREELDAFAQARLDYRHAAGRLFPSWSEVFELLLQLGYRRSSAA